MGMFTRIIHPKDGRELQIKTGEDGLETYRVGDRVRWYIMRDWAGRGALFDGAYDSYSDRGEDDWVIIKKHRVHAVVPRKRALKLGWRGLMRQYRIRRPRRSMWSKEAWAEQKRIEEKCRLEAEQWDRDHAHLDKQQFIMAKFLMPLSRPLYDVELVEDFIKAAKHD